MDEAMNSLQRGIERRQKELHDVAERIARHGFRLSRLSSGLRLATITLGAIAAAKGTFDAAFGSPGTTMLFSFLGIAISIAAGIEAAFNLQKRGAELTLLASTCQSLARRLDSDWRSKIGSVFDQDVRAALRELIAAADDKLDATQKDAARLGVNITLEVYELDGEGYRERYAA
jgi:hypothetical protein